MKELNKIAHPLFIVSLSLLILNDWYFKTAFHNEITGKVSDFAGLFAFPFFLSALSPNNKKTIHYMTGVLFVFWNSEFSQPLLNGLNGYGLPVMRTVDTTDNMALVSIFASYKCLSLPFAFKLPSILQGVLMIVSCLSFVATTFPPRENRKFVDIDKEYQFEFSRRELVSRLNMVQLKEIRSLNKSSGEIAFDSQTNVFHYHGETDTLAVMLDDSNITEDDTIEFKTSFAEVLITGDQSKSTLKLLTVYKLVPVHKDKDFKKKAVKHFERRIIKKIKKYR